MSIRLGALAQTGGRLTAVPARVEHGDDGGVQLEFGEQLMALASVIEVLEVRRIARREPT